MALFSANLWNAMKGLVGKVLGWIASKASIIILVVGSHNSVKFVSGSRGVSSTPQKVDPADHRGPLTLPPDELLADADDVSSDDSEAFPNTTAPLVAPTAPEQTRDVMGFVRLRLGEVGWRHPGFHGSTGNGWSILPTADLRSHAVYVLAVRGVHPEAVEIHLVKLDDEEYFDGTWGDADWQRVIKAGQAWFIDHPERFIAVGNRSLNLTERTAGDRLNQLIELMPM